MLRKLLFFVFLNYVYGSFNLNMKYPETRNGYIMPLGAKLNKNISYVLEGEDVIFQLTKLPKGFDKCLVTTPDADLTTELKPDVKDGKITYWNMNSMKNNCGVRVRNVSLEDVGRWKLQALNNAEQNQIQSFYLLRVKPYVKIPDKELTLTEGESTVIDLTDVANYCEVLNPLTKTESNLFDDCKIDITNVHKKHAGVWTINAGVYGTINEITLQPNINVLGETFDVGFVKHDSKISMYCNLKNSIGNTTFSFCRFTKKYSKIGFRLYDGLSNGDYSYYGQTLNLGECGLTIENPSADDLTLWTCSLGLFRSNVYETRESIISLSDSKSLLRSTNNNEILSGIGSPLTISCTSNAPLEYCIIIHPNKTTYAVHNKFKNDYWKTVSNLEVGECSLQIIHSTKNETGDWLCQMGKSNIFAMDEIITIPVRIGATALVAVEKSISTDIGKTITLKCIAVAENIALDYCRFKLPDGNGFKISEKVTKKLAIKNQYWYNGTSLVQGDCQVTINEVLSEHIGNWECAGKISDSDELESFDNIEISVPEDQLSTAAISEIVAGCVGILVILIGATILYKRKKRNSRNVNRENDSHRSSSSEQQIFTRNLQNREPEVIQIEENNQEAGNEIEMTGIRQPTDEAATS